MHLRQTANHGSSLNGGRAGEALNYTYDAALATRKPTIHTERRPIQYQPCALMCLVFLAQGKLCNQLQASFCSGTPS